MPDLKKPNFLTRWGGLTLAVFCGALALLELRRFWAGEELSWFWLGVAGAGVLIGLGAQAAANAERRG